jgi:hypothetical protein
MLENDSLNKRGYKVEIKAIPCNVMAIAQENNKLHSVSDQRDIGISTAQ